MVSITLKAKYHALIAQLIPDKGRVDVVNYLIQLKKAMASGYNAEADITVSVTEDLVQYCFYNIGGYPERLVAADNSAIKTALLPQLQSSPDLLQGIGSIVAQNSTATEQLRTSGVNAIQSIVL